MDFFKKNRQDWIGIQQKLFPSGLPEKCEWTDKNEIVNVLRTIGSIKNSNHMFYPRGGGLDVEGAGLSSEKDCIEIDTGGLIDILKPSRLIFHSFKNEEPQWNYFRLETLELKPSGIYDNEDYDEELCELTSGEYISRAYWDEGKYNGKKLPSEARVITRHFGGSFVIFQKTSIYNRNSRTYDGRHNKMTDEEFRNYIQNVINQIGTSNWNE
jgi:hypothetical protein